MAEKLLITGGQGSIGSWIARLLLEEGVDFALCDPMPQNSVLARILAPEQLASLERVFLKLGDPSSLARAFAERRITRVVHLAQSGDPGSAADQSRSLFEAAGASGGRVSMVAYLAGGGGSGDRAPGSLLDRGVASVGLSFGALYGVGREGAPDRAATLAIRAAVLSRRFTIPFRGAAGFTYLEDAARSLIRAALSDQRAALSFRVVPQAVPVEEFIREIERAVPGAAGLIDCAGEPLSPAPELEEADFQEFLGARAFPATPLSEGIARTAALFRSLAAEGRLQQD